MYLECMESVIGSCLDLRGGMDQALVKEGRVHGISLCLLPLSILRLLAPQQLCGKCLSHGTWPQALVLFKVVLEI